MVDERIARRRAEVRAGRRAARLRRTLLVALLLTITGAGVWFERSEYATVVEVRVAGVDRLDVTTVMERSGVGVGDAALRLRPGASARRIEELTLVRAATVRRTGLRVVHIDIQERAPIYTAVHRATGVLVDRDGVVIDQGRRIDLPEVRLRSAPPEPGELVVAHAALANAHRAWVGLSGPLRSRVVAMSAPDPDGLEMLLDTGQTVRFGRAELLEDKVRALGAILDDVSGSEIIMIDVRVPDFPVVRID